MRDITHGINLYRTCISKRRYKTIEFAQKWAKIYAEKYGKELRVYYCPYCGGYHLTTSINKKKKGDE